MQVKCPECDVHMEEVKTSSHYGIPIVIDQCEKCGGLWFDEDELHGTKLGKAHEIEKRLNVQKLRKFSELKKSNLICPRDHTALKELKDISFPANIKIEICKNCGGFWFNYGEFVEFQNHWAKKRKETAQKEIDKLKDLEINRELDKRVVSIMKLYHQLDEEKRKDKDKKNLETVVYIIWILLNILLGKKI